MIVKEVIPQRYGSLFLALEADGEEPAQRKNIKVVSVPKRKDRRTSFEDIGVDPIEASNEPDDGDDSFSDIGEEESDTSGDNTVTADTGMEEDEEGFSDIGEEPAESGGGEAEVTTGEDGSTTITASDGTDDTAVDEDEGFDDIGSDTETGENPPENNETGNDENKKEGPGLEYDSTRKYVLFKEFMGLHNSVNNYISKLENTLSDDPATNYIYKTCTKNLREIRDILYDFMILKYETSRYVQSLLFYEKMVASVQIVFNILNKAIKIKGKTKK